MKKTFKLTHPKIKPARQVEAVKHEIKKYIKRERNKTLPKEADFWDFDCKYGETEAEADIVHLSQLNKCIDKAEAAGLESCYIEIMAKIGIRTPKPADDFDDEEYE